MVMKYEQHIDNETGMVSEATAAIRVNSGCATAAYDETMYEEPEKRELPSDILRMALVCALDNVKKGRAIPHDRMMDIIEAEMGWK